MIIGLSGKAGSGKDTVYKMIAEELPAKCINVKFSQALKDEASRILGVPLHKWESQEFKATVIPTAGNMRITYRDFLLQFGTDLMRSVDPDWWVNKGMNKFKEDILANHIVTDMRFPNEFEAIKEVGGIMVRIECVGNEGADHISDRALDDHKFDYTIVANRGDIEGLRKSVKELLRKITPTN